MEGFEKFASYAQTRESATRSPTRFVPAGAARLEAERADAIVLMPSKRLGEPDDTDLNRGPLVGELTGNVGYAVGIMKCSSIRARGIASCLY